MPRFTKHTFNQTNVRLNDLCARLLALCATTDLQTRDALRRAQGAWMIIVSRVEVDPSCGAGDVLVLKGEDKRARTAVRNLRTALAEIALHFPSVELAALRADFERDFTPSLRAVSEPPSSSRQDARGCIAPDALP